MIVVFLFLINLLFPTHAATITPPSSLSNLPTLFNLTSGNQPNISFNRSLAVEGGDWKWYCTPPSTARRWNVPPMEQDDCQGVLEYFYYETMTDGGTRSREFISPGARKTKHLKGEMTPRKYTFGTCTLAIIIVEDFPLPYTLPGGYKTGPPTDSTNYYNLNQVAANLVDRCVFDDKKAGWQPTGQHDGIGVFIWSTNSQQDEEIEDDNEKTRFLNPALETSGNGSAMMS